MKIIAHRGFSSNCPENTLLAFEKALEAGADGIETDLRLSQDNKIVLFHDATLLRMTGQKGSIETSTLAELKSYEVKGEKIATLEELLSLVQGRLTLILEIKYHPKTYQKLCELLVEKIADKKSWVEISCFEDRVLTYIDHLDPDVRLHKLIKDALVLKEERFHERYRYISYLDIAVSLRKTVLASDLTEKYKVILWTVDKEDISKEKNAGIYGIMVNNISKYIKERKVMNE